MNGKKRDRKWNPYLAGALAGLLAIGSAYATTKVMGRTAYFASTAAYVRAAAVIEQRILPGRVEKKEAFKKAKTKDDWQLMLVCGIFLGALAAALTGGAFEWEGVPPMWHKRFGPSEVKRSIGGFLGGVVAMFGARLADGCPVGHGLSGVMQLSVAGLATTVCFFAGGLMVASGLHMKDNFND
ncbi:MAG: YeeE/YedE thiosulfate transporter family protein [Kiritimatiellae bacterium]|nr:YeeE/YedE thiosulfate transporter family protein [Kiritimatiellia bacterium]